MSLGAFKCSTVIDTSEPGVVLIPQAPIVTPQQAFDYAVAHEMESAKQESICQKCEAQVTKAVERAKDAVTLAEKQQILAPVLPAAKQAIDAAQKAVAHKVAADKSRRADVTTQKVKVNLRGMVPNSIATGKVFGLPVAGKGFLDQIKRDVRLPYQMPSVKAGGGYQYQWNQKHTGTNGTMSKTLVEQRQVFGSMLSGSDTGRLYLSGLGNYSKVDDDPLKTAQDIAKTTNEVLAALNEFGKLGTELSKMFAGRWVPQCLWNSEFVCDDQKLAQFINVEYPAIHGKQPTEASVIAIGKEVLAKNANEKSWIRSIIRNHPPPKEQPPPVKTPPGGNLPGGGGGGTVSAGPTTMIAAAIAGAGILTYILTRK